jgi:hypothetical protein
MIENFKMLACPVPEFIDPVFAKTSPQSSFTLSARIYRPSVRKNKHKTFVSLIENERFRLVFVKTGSINSGTDLIRYFLNILQPAFVQFHSRVSCRGAFALCTSQPVRHDFFTFKKKF